MKPRYNKNFPLNSLVATRGEIQVVQVQQLVDFVAAEPDSSALLFHITSVIRDLSHLLASRKNFRREQSVFAHFERILGGNLAGAFRLHLILGRL